MAIALPAKPIKGITGRLGRTGRGRPPPGTAVRGRTPVVSVKVPGSGATLKVIVRFSVAPLPGAAPDTTGYGTISMPLTIALRYGALPPIKSICAMLFLTVVLKLRSSARLTPPAATTGSKLVNTCDPLIFTLKL